MGGNWFLSTSQLQQFFQKERLIPFDMTLLEIFKILHFSICCLLICFLCKIQHLTNYLNKLHAVTVIIKSFQAVCLPRDPITFPSCMCRSPRKRKMRKWITVRTHSNTKIYKSSVGQCRWHKVISNAVHRLLSIGEQIQGFAFYIIIKNHSQYSSCSHMCSEEKSTAMKIEGHLLFIPSWIRPSSVREKQISASYTDSQLTGPSQEYLIIM